MSAMAFWDRLAARRTDLDGGGRLSGRLHGGSAGGGGGTGGGERKWLVVGGGIAGGGIAGGGIAGGGIAGGDSRDMSGG